jgi:hypothetical protein
MATQNILGSVMHKIFGAPTPAPAPAQPAPTNNLQTNPPPQGTHSSQNVAPNGTIPANPDGTPQGSPDDKFAKLWETTPTDPNKQTQEPQGLTPEQMLQAAAKVDFAKVIDKETLAKITAGGEDAAVALLQALNKVSQQTYAQTVLVTDKLITAQVQKAQDDFASKVPDLVKRQRVQDDLIKDNPAFKDPAVSPVVGLIQNQLAEKFPQATADELRVMAIEYFQGAANKLSPPKKTGKASEPKENQEDDWEDWLTKQPPLN